MTTDITPAERRLADEVQARFGWDLFAPPKHTLWSRLDAFWRTHPDVSAGLSFVLTAVLAGSTVRFALAQVYLWMTVAYLAALAAGIFGAFETKRAGQGGAR